MLGENSGMYFVYSCPCDDFGVTNNEVTIQRRRRRIIDPLIHNSPYMYDNNGDVKFWDWNRNYP